MRTPFFRRLFIFFAIILIVSVIFMELYITRIVRQNYIENIRKNLEIQALLIADESEFIPGFVSKTTLSKLKDLTEARITIILPDGRVIGDSDKDITTMDNHGNRPEIQQAGISGTGWSIRRSNTLKTNLFYTAVLIERKDGPVGYVRLAVPLKEVNNAINALRFKIIGGMILVILATGLLSIVQTVRVRSYVQQIVEFAGALARGILTKRLHIAGAGEFSEIAEDLNKMAKDLKALLSLKDAEASRLNVILQSIPDPLLIINKEGIVERANDSSRELIGNRSPLGKHAYEVVRSPEFFDLLDEVKEKNASLVCDIRIEEPVERYLTTRISPLFYREGDLAGFIALLHDTTRMKKLEEIRKDFVANVSHEIKTPVTAIRGFAETLLDGAINDKENALKFLNTIHENSKRLNRLVDDLLMISKIELGVEKIHKADLDLTEVADNVISTLSAKAQAKGLTIKQEVDTSSARIEADRDRITEIILNLTDNAIKFTEKGEITIGLKKENGAVFLFVQDTGIGVPQKYIPRLGERFFRVDTSRSRELGGTGLGLAIVKHLVLAHGWEMKIESEEGKGTIVKIFIS